MVALGLDKTGTFVTEDFLILDAIHRELAISDGLRYRLPHLEDLGAVEKAGSGKYRLSRGYYRLTGQRSAYTRKQGLDHETNKALLLRHIKENDVDGSPLKDLMQVLPNLSRRQVQALLREMRAENQVHSQGRTSLSRWYQGAMVAPNV